LKISKVVSIRPPDALLSCVQLTEGIWVARYGVKLDL